MPEPSPSPTPEQIVTVAEIVMLTVDEVTEMIAADPQDIADAKWALTLADISTWSGIVDEANDIKRVGSIEFFEGTIGVSRLSFRNKIRGRYGKPLLSSENGAEVGQGCTVSSGKWF